MKENKRGVLGRKKRDPGHTGSAVGVCGAEPGHSGARMRAVKAR